MKNIWDYDLKFNYHGKFVRSSSNTKFFVSSLMTPNHGRLL